MVRDDMRRACHGLWLVAIVWSWIRLLRCSVRRVSVVLILATGCQSVGAQALGAEGLRGWYGQRRDALYRDAPKEVAAARQHFDDALRLGNSEWVALWGGWYLSITSGRQLASDASSVYNKVRSQTDRSTKTLPVLINVAALLGMAHQELAARQLDSAFANANIALRMAEAAGEADLIVESKLTLAALLLDGARSAEASALLVDVLERAKDPLQVIEARSLLLNAATFSASTPAELNRVVTAAGAAQRELYERQLPWASLSFAEWEASALARSGRGDAGLTRLLALREDLLRRGMDATAVVVFRISRSADLALALANSFGRERGANLCTDVLSERLPSPEALGTSLPLMRLRTLCRAAIQDPSALAAVRTLENEAARAQVIESAAFEETLWNSIASAYAMLGRFEDAYRSARQYRLASLKRVARGNEISRLEIESRYQTAAKEKENAELRARERLADQRRSMLWGALAFALLAIAVVGELLRRQFAQRKRLAKLASELASANGDLVSANEQLNTLSASRTRLLAAACHDLRQPAHALGMLAEIASARAMGQEVATMEAIRRSSGNLSEMLDALFDLSRLESDRYVLAISAVRLGDLFEDLRTQFAVAAISKGLTLQIEETQATVMSDAHLLRRIAMNLLSNAIKYTERGHVRMAVERDGSDWILSVVDTGPGIPAAQQEAVFMEYVRLESAGAADGLGIGLALVKRSASLLGHALELRSALSQGSCFMLRLPAADDSAPTVGSEVTVTGEGQLIGVVDDDVQIRDAMGELLRLRGYRVCTADSLQQLDVQLVQAGTPSPDLLISDLHLRGTDVLDELIARVGPGGMWAGVPTVLITGDLSATVLTRAAQVGIAVTHKPLPARKLVRMIHQMLVIDAAQSGRAPSGHPSSCNSDVGH